MDFFKVVEFEKAKEIIQHTFCIDKLDVLTLSLYDAVGYRVAEDIASAENLPDYARSTIDGFAVKAANTYGANDGTPAILKIVGYGKIGVLDDITLKSGEAYYVPTGGAIVNGADSTVMVEHCEVFGDSVAVYRPSCVNENIIGVGDDVKAGDTILKKGEKITAFNVGTLAASGFGFVKVFRPIKVAIISTGDEIVGISDKTKIGQIRDVNTVSEQALCTEAGFEVVYKSRIEDGFDLLRREVLTAEKIADIVLISGGSSIGMRDYTEKVLAQNGKILVHGVAIKPGKPTIVAKLGNALAVGLPGHPTACLLVLKLLVINALNELFEKREQPFVFAKTAVNFPSSPGRTTVQPVRLEYNSDGVFAVPLFYKSGLISVMSEADGFIIVARNSEGITKNEIVKVFLL